MTKKKADEIESTLGADGRMLVDFLKGMLKERDAQNAALTEQLKNLNEQLAEMRRMLFGPRSEKLPPMESEVRRVVDADELTVDGEPMPPDGEPRVKAIRRRARKKSEAKRLVRRKLRKNLPVVHERVTVTADQLPAGTTRQDFRQVACGDPVRRIEHVREHLVVMEYELETLASKHDEYIVKAKAPAGVSPGCQYGPGLHAHVVVSKCADSIPVYRLAKMLERSGGSIARSTLCAMGHRAAKLLTPLYDVFLETARADKYVHADETTLSVQRKGGCLKGWVWGIMSRTVLVYAFRETRAGEHAEELLGDTTGYLTVDGYSGYNGVEESDDPGAGRVRTACWGHARRKFFVAMRNVPASREVLEMIVELYVVERKAADKGILGTPAHGKLRATKSAAIVKRIDEWVDHHEGEHAPKSAMGKALTYAKNQRERLHRFLEDPKLPLDNNYAERALRIIALGRKNFLFAGSTDLAQNLAILQSIVSTCQLHAVNPYEYIKDVLVRIRDRDPEDLDELMPWNWAPPPEPVPTVAPPTPV